MNISCKSLYERVNQHVSCDNIVDSFYKEVLQDDRISPFFAYMNIEEQSNKIKKFILYAFGEQPDTVEDYLSARHARLVTLEGLTDFHFSAFVEDFKKTLVSLRVPEDLMEEAVQRVGNFRNHILNRSQ